MDSTATSATAQVSILFFPYMAQGHMLPMLDLAKLLSVHGATVSILTTPANAPLVQSSIDRSRPRIPVHLIPFPSAAVGLPLGCEHRSSIPSDSLRPNFYRGLALLRSPFARALDDIRPDFVVTDMFLPWTCAIAQARAIPRLLFDGTGFFARCAEGALKLLHPLSISSSSSFTLPHLPHRIEMLFSQTMKGGASEINSAFAAIIEEVKEADPNNYGVLVNSFYELEPDYVEHHRNKVGRKAWHVGPLSLCNFDSADNALRGSGWGGTTAIDGERVLGWLDRQRRGSVVYVCFGSGASFKGEQIREMALGLEAAGHPFVWVVQKAGQDWFPDGFEERGKGLVLGGWVPQLLILNHAAVGGFMTHCGWNSVLEGICAGRPMATWPLFAEQFYNERFLVDVVRVGVSVGSKVYAFGAEERPVIGARLVEEAVMRLMGEGEEAEERRVRAGELAEKARRAVEKGGSSFNNVQNLIQELRERKTMLNNAAAPQDKDDSRI